MFLKFQLIATTLLTVAIIIRREEILCFTFICYNMQYRIMFICYCNFSNTLTHRINIYKNMVINFSSNYIKVYHLNNINIRKQYLHLQIKIKGKGY